MKLLETPRPWTFNPPFCYKRIINNVVNYEKKVTWFIFFVFRTIGYKVIVSSPHIQRARGLRRMSYYNVGSFQQYHFVRLHKCFGIFRRDNFDAWDFGFMHGFPHHKFLLLQKVEIKPAGIERQKQ